MRQRLALQRVKRAGDAGVGCAAGRVVGDDGVGGDNPAAGDTGMYAPMIHPWSGTDKLGSDNTHILYYNVSYWGEYNVRLMQTDLSPMRPDAAAGETITV